VRAVPGQYTVRMAAGGTRVEQPLRVRQDPNVTATDADMAAWHAAATKIERMECTAAAAETRVSQIDEQLEQLIASDAPAATALRADAQRVRDELRPIVLGLMGDVRDPGHINLPSRVNWLTIQVGNYPGRPTAAQSEWIDRYAAMADDYVARLRAIEMGSLAALNERLRTAGLAVIGG
jgi:hypothetical protein